MSLIYEQDHPGYLRFIESETGTPLMVLTFAMGLPSITVPVDGLTSLQRITLAETLHRQIAALAHVAGVRARKSLQSSLCDLLGID